MKKFIYLFIVLIFVFFQQNFSQTKGHLLIIGGVQTPEIEKKFVELAGGSDARIIIIPNAGSEPKLNSEIEQKRFIELGAKADYILFSRETADDEANLEKMEWANAVFFTGGDQSDLTRDMLGTKLLQKVFDIYNIGGTVGGTSAGAAVMSEVMITEMNLLIKIQQFHLLRLKEVMLKPNRGLDF